MSHPDDNLQADTFSLEDVSAYGALFADTPGTFDEGDDPEPPRAFTAPADDFDAPPRDSFGDNDDPWFDEDDPIEAQRGGLLSRWKRGMALAKDAGDDRADDERREAKTSDGGLLSRWKRGMALAKESDDTDPLRSAGIDTSAPTGARRRTHVDESPTISDDDFSRLLTPLADSEIRRLQAETQQEDAVIVLLDRARYDGERHGRLGGLIALLSIFALIMVTAARHATDGIVALATDGLPRFFIDPVEQAALPAALTDRLAVNGDVLQGVATVLFFLAIIPAARTVASGVTATLLGATTRSPVNLIRGAVGCALGVAMFSSLVAFKPVTVFAVGAGWWLINRALTTLGRRRGL